LPTLSPAQQRDLLLLFLERVEIRPAAKSGAPAGSRRIDLRLKVRVARLVEGMEERLIIDARERPSAPAASARPLVLQTDVAMTPAGGVELLTPFVHALSTPRKRRANRPAPAPARHPLHRARSWQRRLESEPGLNRVTLAKEEGLTPGAVTHNLKLLQLAPAIQEQLLNVTAFADLRRFSLNRMKALAELPADVQLSRFITLRSA